MKWSIHESCGNSPRNQTLIDWIQAFFEEEGPHPFIDEAASLIYNAETMSLAAFSPPKHLDEIQLENAITHGRVGAVLGKAFVDNQTHPFALFLEFSLGKQPKIREVNCIVHE